MLLPKPKRRPMRLLLKLLKMRPRLQSSRAKFRFLVPTVEEPVAKLPSWSLKLTKTKPLSSWLRADTKAKNTQPAGEVDYKAGYEQLMAPFKANGKTMQVKSVEVIGGAGDQMIQFHHCLLRHWRRKLGHGGGIGCDFTGGVFGVVHGV